MPFSAWKHFIIADLITLRGVVNLYNPPTPSSPLPHIYVQFRRRQPSISTQEHEALVKYSAPPGSFNLLWVNILPRHYSHTEVQMYNLFPFRDRDRSLTGEYEPRDLRLFTHMICTEFWIAFPVTFYCVYRFHDVFATLT